MGDLRESELFVVRGWHQFICYFTNLSTKVLPAHQASPHTYETHTLPV